MAFAGTSFYLIGSKGSGKSSTGNNILGQRAFATTTSTGTIKKMQSVLKSHWLVEVVDGPSLMGRSLIRGQGDMLSFQNEVTLNSDSGKVFLFVHRFGKPTTSDYEDITSELQSVFGKDVFANHGIVVVTHGDIFKAQFPISFESWCDFQIKQNVGIGNLIKLCGGRIVLIDDSPSGSDHLVEKLQSFMPGISYGKMPFECSKLTTFINFFRYRPLLTLAAVVFIVLFVLCS